MDWRASLSINIVGELLCIWGKDDLMMQEVFSGRLYGH